MRPQFLALACAAVSCAGPVPAVSAVPGAVVERHLVAMGTDLTLEVEALDRATALAASEAAVRAIESVERRLSTWREDSELARLNRTPLGVPFASSPALVADLARADALRRATSGAFDPGIGALVEVWGLRSGGRIPGATELERALAGGGLASLALVGSTATRRSDGMRIEEGGFGKGVGLDAAVLALEEAGARAALVDLGGQVIVWTKEAHVGARPTAYGIAHPMHRERPVLDVEIDAGSIATSGNSERGLVVEGERFSHLLDPRTGRPAPMFGSVTVWALDATTADALSTGLYVMGPDTALAWAARHGSIEVLVLEPIDDGRALRATCTSGWRGRVNPRTSDVEVRFLEETDGTKSFKP